MEEPIQRPIARKSIAVTVAPNKRTRKNRDILHVKYILGHKQLENTEIYTHLVEFESNEYHVAHAKTIEEEDKLVESGFQFIRYDQNSQISIYRKRK